MDGHRRGSVARRLVLCVALVLSSCTGPPAASRPTDRVLVFSKTTGFRHSSIPAGIAAVHGLGAANRFAVDATEDADAFRAPNLARYRAVVFLSTTGDVLDAGQQDAFAAYIRGGGGYVGVHAAADTEYDWPFYGELVGAYFAHHPTVQPARLVVEDRRHPATAHLGATWERTDEWYDFRTDPRPKVHVLVSLDESSYRGATMGGDHPIAWYRSVDRGRSFYTAGGHDAAAFAEPDFRAHLLGGIRYAAGLR